jgi:3-phenylpropionate/trans-cinnamate dioxygenase ferredoxin component
VSGGSAVDTREEHMPWVPVAPAASIPAGDYTSVEVDGHFVAVFNVNGEFLAVEDVCTHDGEGLAGGELDGDVVVCPRHGARFCLRTGAALTPPAYEPVRTYATRIIDGMVEVRTG